MATKAKRKTTDALKIIDALYFNGRPEMQARLREAEERLLLAERLRELRELQGMTQQEVADRMGTKRSVVARLEQAGYEKHTVSTLRKFSSALGYTVRVDFVPVATRASAKKSTAAAARSHTALTIATKQSPKRSRAKA